MKYALANRTDHRYFGLSGPELAAASHRCKFRCHVFGQCEDDAVFARYPGGMVDWGKFEELLHDAVVVSKQKIIMRASEALGGWHAYPN